MQLVRRAIAPRTLIIQVLSLMLEMIQEEYAEQRRSTTSFRETA